MRRMEKSLPLPEMGEQNLSYSFKNLNKTSSNKKPPKLYGNNLSRIRSNYSSSLAQPITFRSDADVYATQLSPIYQKDLPESYFQQCFEIVSKIGEGSFGEVFKVRCREDGQFYAVKKSKEYFRSKEYRRERLEEVKRYEEFSEHEHCVTLYRAWEQDYQLYMQMELCHGSLESYVLEKKHIPEPQIWSFMLDLLLALKSFHHRNLIHLDVKLDNILIAADGTCKLGDFGLMFDLERDNGKAVEGDSRYIAPEELEGKFSKAADIFSLGITILELTCNLELPANGMLWQQLRSNVFPPEIVNLLPQELFQIVRRMMAPDWQERPTVEQLLAYPRLKGMLNARRKWTFINRLKKWRYSSVYLMWQKVAVLKKWIVGLVLSITALFSLRHRKLESNDTNGGQPIQSTPCSVAGSSFEHRHQINVINASPTSAIDTSSDSTDALIGVQRHRDSPLLRFHGADRLLEVPLSSSGAAMDSNMYSSTPINHSGINLRRRGVLMTPQSPVSECGSFNRTSFNNSEHVSSFTVKKLFEQSDDSDSRDS